ncbi:MAG: TRAP transporter small permease [Peptococcaceae bacterium]|jgi:C4-dicarboxylate transporter DctQ subunit|nr:TRAP transporter small permease [Peptococcaceae bacterium]
MKNLLSKLDEILSIIVMAIMLAITFANVVSRYGLHASISFTEEITTALFVLLCVLGTGIAAKRRAHLGLGTIIERLSGKNKAWAAFIGNLLSAVFSAILAYYGVLMVINQYRLKQITMTLQWPEWIYGAFIPVGACYMCYQFIKMALISWREAGK